ncbi:hypothetical protein [Natrinema salaciae]|uniref:Uncharacterized protein n=1 Tax=Natrinema salaciae TaxID=1186196 RepID=A0A1H9P4K3_9EURY|nr:hypothetical protein [Natrinema salaciae]SER42997.1 hypothetical protein SAMN04489841_3857 [Natrinema salaciae]
MDIERRDGEIVSFESQDGAVFSVEVGGGPCRVDLASLKPLTEIRDHAPDINPDEIAAVLGYSVTSFDGDPIYHGRMDGLELSYEVVDAEDEVTMLVVSFGEVQPGRYAAATEALVRTSSRRF